MRKQKFPWSTIQKRLIMKCRAARSKAVVAFEKEDDQYRSTSDFLKAYITHAEHLAENLGDILIAYAIQVVSDCPDGVVPFRNLAPSIVRDAVSAYDKESQEGKVHPSVRPSQIIEKEWDQQRKAVLEEKWKRVEDALVERQTHRVDLALEEAMEGPDRIAVITSTEAPPKTRIKDPASDLNMISLQEASEEFNIPKPSLTRAARKKPGEFGYLRCVRVKRKVYFWRRDVQGLKRSRVPFRGRQIGKTEPWRNSQKPGGN